MTSPSFACLSALRDRVPGENLLRSAERLVSRRLRRHPVFDDVVPGHLKGWLRPVRSPVDLFVEVLEIGLEVRLVVLLCHPVHAGSGLALKRVKRRPERIDTDMVEERGELFLLPLPCGLPYAAQRLVHASPALRPVRALLIRVPLGPRPA